MPSDVVEKLAREMVGSERDAFAQCRRLIQWMHQGFEWTVTDYQGRTTDEILLRRAGNCAEQARVLDSLVRSLEIETRRIGEINIQSPRIERGQFAEKRVAEMGPSASVFGYMHNDHRWLEVKDTLIGERIPADATLGICGAEDRSEHYLVKLFYRYAKIW